MDQPVILSAVRLPVGKILNNIQLQSVPNRSSI